MYTYHTSTVALCSDWYIVNHAMKKIHFGMSMYNDGKRGEAEEKMRAYCARCGLLFPYSLA